MFALAKELRYSVRVLRRDRLFTAAAVITLAIGIGLNAAMFSVVDAVLLRPLPVERPDRLVRVFSATPEDPLSHSPLTWGEVTDLRGRTSTFDAVAAFTYTSLVIEHGGSGRLVLGELVTGNYFDTLGVVPALGRLFDVAGFADTASEPASAAPVAILSHSAWSRRFGADPEVVGRSVRINGVPFTVIGVTRPDFCGMTRGLVPEVWLPLGANRLWNAGDPADAAAPASGGVREPAFLWTVARLGEGASPAAARDAVAATAERRTGPGEDRRTLVIEPANRVRILPGIDQRLEAGSWLLLGVVALVLLIACSNVANLCLARTLGRRGEIATRISLGAGTAAIIRQLLVEGTLLAGAGAGLGLLLAGAATRALSAVRLPLPVDLAVGARLDGRVLAFTAGIAVLTTLVFSLVPALTAARTDLVREMREGGSARARGRRRLSASAVVVQIAVSLALLIGGGLCLRSLWGVRNLDLGYQPEGAVVASFAPHLQGYGRARADRFYRRLLTQVRALPGVEAAGMTSHLPLSFELRLDTVSAAEDADESAAIRVDSAEVGPGYFAAMGIPVLRGRAFETDLRSPLAPGPASRRPRGVVVNAALAARLWPDGRAVGQRLRIAGLDGSREVLAVVATGKARTLGEAPRPFLFRPFEASAVRNGGPLEVSSGTVTLVARVRGEAGAALAELRQAVRRADPEVAVSRLTTLEAALAPALLLPRAAAVLFGVFGLLALTLAATGTYGLMAHAAGERRHEVGVRLAIGARRSQVERLLVREGLAPALAGTVCGLALAGLLGRYIEPILFGVSSTDAIAFAGAAAVLLAAALAASYLPARRAARIEPVTALRSR